MKRLQCLLVTLSFLVLPATLSSQWRDRYDTAVLGAGTYIPVRLPSDLSSTMGRDGDEFGATLDRDLVSNGQLIAPAGSLVGVRIVGSEPGRYQGWGFRRELMSLTLSGLEVNSRMFPIETNVITIRTDRNANQRLGFRMQRSMALDMRYGRRGRELARTDDWRDDDRRFNSGSLRWRGRVDGADYIEIRGDQLNIRHVQARPITEQAFDVRSPLPRRPVNVQLHRIQGRGRIELHQQPTASNGYTAVVYVEDESGGDDIYEFELRW